MGLCHRAAQTHAPDTHTMHGGHQAIEKNFILRGAKKTKVVKDDR